MKRVEFYVGLVFQDRSKFEVFANTLNRSVPQDERLEVINAFDDYEGYYTVCCLGTWESYRALQSQNFVKSIAHYEDDTIWQ